MVKKFGLSLHYIAWEIDQQCALITQHHYPQMEHRGNIFEDTPEALAERIDQLDPQRTCRILVTSAPPCPDFSRIKGDLGEGRDGPEGEKFDNWVFVGSLVHFYTVDTWSHSQRM